MARGRARLAAVPVLGLRVAYGVAVIVAPERLTRRWLGQRRPPAMQVPLRGIGGREIAVHGAAMVAALTGAPVRPWLAVSIAGDLSDIAATAAARADVPGGSAGRDARRGRRVGAADRRARRDGRRLTGPGGTFAPCGSDCMRWGSVPARARRSSRPWRGRRTGRLCHAVGRRARGHGRPAHLALPVQRQRRDRGARRRRLAGPVRVPELCRRRRRGGSGWPPESCWSPSTTR